MAREHGVADDVIAAIGAGAQPAFPRHDERVVHAIARELASTGHLSDETYAAGRDLLGEQGLVELVTLCGYYALVSFTLNAFEVPLPDGVAPTFA
jgi:4-carboxymuconolactone decarboxylase